MLTQLITPALHIAIITLLVAIAYQYTMVRFNLKWLMVSLVIFSGYWFVNITGFDLFAVKRVFPGLSWDWGIKLTLLLCSLLALIGLMRLQPGFKASDAGFTLKQKPGSIKVALLAFVFLLVFRYYLSFLLGGDDGSRDPEELLFLATMHGIDKEPLYRGILLYTLSLAIVSTECIIAGAKINLAGILLVVLFTLAHSLTYNGSDWFVFPVGFLSTGFHGLVYLWMRERTGSLLFPIMSHNAVVFFGQLL